MKKGIGVRGARWLLTVASTCLAFSLTAKAADLPPIKLALIEGMSGPFANAGAMVERNLRFGVERVNAQGGVKLADGMHPLQLVVFDGKGSSEATLVQLRAAIDDGIGFVMQGNSSAVAAALVAAIDKQNAREPDRRVLFLNYSADDPALTNDACSFWHFRFDAHAGHAHGRARRRAERRSRGQEGLSAESGLQLRPRRESRGAARAQGAAAGYRDCRRRVSSDRPREGFRALHRQDPFERGGRGDHRQLGQRPDAAGESGARAGARHEVLHVLRKQSGRAGGARRRWREARDRGGGLASERGRCGIGCLLPRVSRPLSRPPRTITSSRACR